MSETADTPSPLDLSSLAGKTVLVTGGAGRIGSAVAVALREHGVVARTTDSAPGADIVADLRDLDAVAAALDGCAAVVHAGAIPSDREGREQDVLDVNVRGTWNVLLSCVRQKIARAAVFSSVNAFGSFGYFPIAYLPGDDDYPERQRSHYQLSKQLVEELSRYYVRNHDFLTAVCLRPVFVAGERAYTRWREQPMGDNMRVDLFAYVDLSDVVDATLRALIAEVPDRYAACLLTADDTASITPTAELVARHFPDAVWKIDLATWLADNPHKTLVDCRVAREALGWRPKVRWRG